MNQYFICGQGLPSNYDDSWRGGTNNHPFLSAMLGHDGRCHQLLQEILASSKNCSSKATPLARLVLVFLDCESPPGGV